MQRVVKDCIALQEVGPQQDLLLIWVRLLFKGAGALTSQLVKAAQRLRSV